MMQNEHFLNIALQLANTRRGFCAPNPAVGAVVVKDGNILAQGCHQGAGHPHAEVVALQQLDAHAAQGATIYVTLEPCCHWGRTPPCTQLLIERGIKKVVYGIADPNPKVAKQGIAQLEAAGITCELLNLPQISEFYTSYIHWWHTGKPYVTAKLAQSLDGKTAQSQGKPVRLTGSMTDEFTHLQRLYTDAILTTAKTIRYDDPLLNVRLAGNCQVKPLYILDSQLVLSGQEKIFSTGAAITIFHQGNVAKNQVQCLTERGARCVTVSVNKFGGMNEFGLNLEEVLQQIGQDGMHDLWVEAGATCFQALLMAKLVQQTYVYVAPICLGSDAYPGLSMGRELLADVQTVSWQVSGQDAICRMRFNTCSQAS